MPSIDPRFEHLHLGEVAIHCCLGCSQGGTGALVVGLGMLRQSVEHKKGMAEEEEICLGVVAFLFIHLCLETRLVDML